MVPKPPEPGKSAGPGPRPRQPQRVVTMKLHLDKSEQYKRVLREYPQLLQRIALKDLAAYLFVTPQSLSRIRAEIK